jgi:hypothetical protein
MANDVERIAIEIEILKEREAEARVAALAAKIKAYAKEMNASFRAVGNGLKESMAGTNAPIDQAVKSLEDAERAAKRAGNGLLSLKNIARTALGTLEAMAIFLISKFVGDAITKTIDSLKQLELSFYKLGIAEKALSTSGVDITPKDLQEISKSVVETFKTVSQIDAQKMVANLTVLTKDLNLTKEQYKQLATIIPLVARQADVSIESATEQIVNGLTKSGKGWADLGITVDANIIKQKAISMGLVATAEAYNDLTAEQKQQIETQALIAIAYEKNIDSLKNQDTYLNSLPGRADTLKASWENLLTTLGITFGPQLMQGLSTLSGWLVSIDGWLKANKESTDQWLSRLSAVVTLISGLSSVGFDDIASGTAGDKIKAAFESARKAEEEAKRLAGDIGQVGPDTPTSIIDPEGIEINGEDAEKAVEEAHKKILDAQLRMNEDIEEAAIDLSRKLDDIYTEYQNKRLDEEQRYQNQVSDINRDAGRKIDQINTKQQEDQAKARQESINKEKEYQNKLKEMRERFLMDLDDALHARDARQILKLIKNFNLEKEQAERRRKLDKEEEAAENKLRQQKYENERKAAEAHRRQQLEDAAIGHQRKLEQLAEEEAREQAQAQLAYERKLQDIQMDFNNRLALIGVGLVEEFNLTKSGLDAILALYQAYYGPGGAIDQVYQGAQARMASSSSLSPGANPDDPQSQPGGYGHGQGGSQYRFAEGGTLFANKPTRVLMGEKGAEMAHFTPLGRIGTDVNKIFSNVSGGSDMGIGGRVEIGLSLSPDLEARIMSNTMKETAKVIVKVNRTK